MVMRKIFISIMVMGILFMSGSVTTSKTLAPLWSYKIEDITDFAMSRNGEYVIVACEKGPSCDEGQYYVFDRYGNTVAHGCIEGEITAVDIADNGAFFIGTRTGYYFSSSAGRIFEDKDLGNIFQSVSISESGEIVIAGTEKEILIFDKHGILTKKEITTPLNVTTVSASGDIAVAGTNSRIFLYKESSDTWTDILANGTISALAVSSDGSTVACGMTTGTIWILDTQLKLETAFMVKGDVESIAMTADGKHLLCGTRKGNVSYHYSTGDEIWLSEIGDTAHDVSISSDGSFFAIRSENIVLFNSSGERIQELRSSEVIKRMYLSKSGEILSHITNEEFFFVELYQQSLVYTYEYMLPSRRSIPLDDQLEIDWSYGSNPLSALAADVNGDGQREIVCNFGQEIVVLTSKGEVIWKKSFAFQFGFNVMDVTGDFISEIIVISRDNRMEFHIFNGEGQKLADHEFYSRWFSVPPPQEISVVMWANWSGDIDNDELIEIVCLVSSGYFLEPRGLYAFEYPSFKEEWYYPMADIPERINFADVNGDGLVEIISGSYAPCNGRSVGNTDDCHAYVYAVTLEGEELWTNQIGPEGYKRIHVTVADLDGDGIQEIVGSGWSFENNWGTLFVLGPEGNYISGKGNELDYSVFLEGVADLDDDGNLEVLTSISGSTVVLFDYELREVKRQDISVETGKLTIVQINDIDADGEKEIVLISEDPKFLILNTDLEEEWSGTFPGYNKYLKAAAVNLNKCKNHLLVLSDKLYAYTYSNNPGWPCVPWVITKEKKINEIENALEEAQKYLEQGGLDKANEYVSQAEDAYTSIKSEGGLEEYYKEIEDMKKAIEDSPTETPESTPETSEPPSTEAPTPSLFEDPVSLGIIGVVIVLIVSLVIFLEMNYKIIRRFIKRKRITPSLMVLSLEKRSETAYQISLESVNKTIYPVKSFKTIEISPTMRSEIIKRIEYTSEVITTYLDPDRKKPLKTPTEELKKMGTVIYKNFIPREFAQKFVHQYIVLDVEDVQVPWELMYDDEFFALKYALSRRIKSEKVSEIYKSKKRERKALIIADPTGTTPEAVTECEYLRRTLQDYLAVTYLKPEKAKKVDVMYHLSQNYDIIHYAGELRKEPCLPVYKDVLTCAEIERTLEGSPVVFLNGCGSAKTFSYSIEGLAEVFLNRGALSYIGSLWSIHDRKAAEIAAEFYRNCLSFPVGEALRLSRKNHYSPEDITWAAFVMYGDPTLNLFR